MTRLSVESEHGSVLALQLCRSRSGAITPHVVQRSVLQDTFSQGSRFPSLLSFSQACHSQGSARGFGRALGVTDVLVFKPLSVHARSVDSFPAIVGWRSSSLVRPILPAIGEDPEAHDE